MVTRAQVLRRPAAAPSCPGSACRTLETSPLACLPAVCGLAAAAAATHWVVSSTLLTPPLALRDDHRVCAHQWHQHTVGGRLGQASRARHLHGRHPDSSH